MVLAWSEAFHVAARRNPLVVSPALNSRSTQFSVTWNDGPTLNAFQIRRESLTPKVCRAELVRSSSIPKRVSGGDPPPPRIVVFSRWVREEKPREEKETRVEARKGSRPPSPLRSGNRPMLRDCSASE